MLADEPAPLPKDVPPVVATAVVSDRGNNGEHSEWAIRLTVPRIAWEVVGEVVPRKEWPELKAEVAKGTLTLRMGGPSALAPSRVVDLHGKDLSREQIIKRLERESPVLVSLSGRTVDPYFLTLTKADALIVILGPRDGYPAPELLPAKKGQSAERKPKAENER
jgi:hypothetical protein